MQTLALYYHTLYLLFVSILTVYTIVQYNRKGVLYKGNDFKMASFFVLIIIVLFIGTRPISGKAFGDMYNYFFHYEKILGDHFYFDWGATNIVWDNFFSWMASNSFSFETWIFIVASLYFGLIYWACYKLFDKNVLLAFIVYLGAFSTFSYGTNGMKAGVAASVFLVAIAYRDKLWISIPVALLSFGFHHSMSMVIAAYLIVLFIKNSNYYLGFWLVCVVLAALHVTFFQTLFASFTDEQGAEYLLSKRGDEYIIGFRPDFILYSAVPIVIGYYLVNKNNYRPKIYVHLLNLYTMTNSLWMLCMYANFSNRIAYLSWLMYPIVLLYPFVFHDSAFKQGKYLRWVVYGHLGFTLVLWALEG